MAKLLGDPLLYFLVAALVAGFLLLRPLLLPIVRDEPLAPPHWTTLTTPAS